MKLLLALFSLSLLAGCSGWKAFDLLTPHRIEIQQGNVVTEEMLARLKPGMTPSQVRFVLGTPLLVDPFRDNRWDYVYSLKRDGKVVEQHRVAVVFEKGVLKSVEGKAPPAPKFEPAKAESAPSSQPQADPVPQTPSAPAEPRP
jgi:outer membrane protein assembly factor BamE